MIEYAANTTIGIKANGKNTLSGTGVFFAFETSRGKVYSVITAKHLLRDAQSISFYFLEEDKNARVLYDKPQEITIEKSNLNIIDHPDSSVDLAMIPIASILDFFHKRNVRLSHHPITENVVPKDSIVQLLNVVETVLMVAHPAGLGQELNHVALITKGNTATPPFIFLNGKKETMISAAQFDGASGAAVFIHQSNDADRYDQRMEGQRILLLGINTATYTKGFTERTYPENNVPQEDVGVVIRSERILEFKKAIERTIKK